MNNYYEILEVSKNASKEVIEKAYKVLAKKYHPDLQKEENKKQAEQKMKLINEAYEVLSDDTRKKQFDIKLEEQLKLQMQEELNRINSQNVRNSQNSNYEKTQKNSNYNSYHYQNQAPLTKEEIRNRRRQEEKVKRYYQEQNERIYRNYLRSLGYRVKERWSLRKTIKLLEVLGVVIIICIILWFFPPTNKIIIETYENNKIIRIIIDVISKIVIGLVQGIGEFFKGIFSKK